ncbi:E3 SUMO-protein ligase [Nesidiocoris tenuis]|uniref:E3 SUMO-protein ligase n=1 Tax=Nesidiocoris tenuis TaxID=355587 RepID=A0ABN7B8Z4_9HEMI|nr:E3 SUMO-protein ligase [Nesidiocoris tenuis]
MPRSCRQCNDPIGPSDLSLDCANPRCSSVCHAQCSAASTFVDEGGRLPRWLCPDCRLGSPKLFSQGRYEPVYGRPRLGGTLRQAPLNQDGVTNRTVQPPFLRDKGRPYPSGHRASTGALLDQDTNGSGAAEVKTYKPNPRPRSAILTPTEEEKPFENLQICPQKGTNMADVPSESKAQTVRPSDISVPPNTPQSGVPISVYSPDEKYEDTVKSFYNWLEQHECRSQDKPKRGGLVADKIAQFGDKLESHLSTRTGTDMPRKSTVGTPKHYPMPKSSATRKISQEEFLDENGDPVMSGISDAKRQNNPGNTRNLSRAAVLVEPSDMGVYKGPVPPPPPMMDAPRMTSASRAPAESKPRAEDVSPGRRMASGPTRPADRPGMASGAGNPTGQQPRHVASGVPAGTRVNVAASKAEIPKPSDPTVAKVASPALKGSAVSQHSPSPIGSSKAATIEQDLPKSVEIRVPKSSSSQRNIVEHEPLFNNVLDIPCRPKAPLDFPPPPPSLLETDLDQLPTGDQQPKTHQELTDDSIGKSAKQSPVKDEEIVKVEPMKVSNWVEGEANGMGKFSKTGQQDVLQDSRTVLHSNLPARGQFTARIDNPDRDVQVRNRLII